RVVRTASLRADAGAMAVDPSGSILYVSTHPSNDLMPFDIEAFDAGTGALKARGVAPSGGLAINALAATTNGVWVGWPGGNLGQAIFLRYPALATGATFRLPRGTSF